MITRHNNDQPFTIYKYNLIYLNAEINSVIISTLPVSQCTSKLYYTEHFRNMFLCLPGVESCATSGTTISVPVKSHLSPACACSTASALRIISTLKKIMLKLASSFCFLPLIFCQVKVKHAKMGF